MRRLSGRRLVGFGPSKRHSAKRRYVKCLVRGLHVERLEDRQMLATIMVDSALDNFNPLNPQQDGVITLREASDGGSYLLVRHSER